MTSFKKKVSSHGLEAAARKALKHLVEHPETKDTVEGIKKYFPHDGRVQRKERDLQEALNVLISRGWVSEIETDSSQKFYLINKDHLKAIKGFLRRTDD